MTVVGSVSVFPEFVHCPHPQSTCCVYEIIHIRANDRVAANPENIYFISQGSEFCFNIVNA